MLHPWRQEQPRAVGGCTGFLETPQAQCSVDVVKDIDVVL